ncbi:MAG: hypothetical protein K2J77_08825 [Oscillospiraceae bacterium]|nr:hypothetical protein [Oscillospiraceae bacterium]
MEINFIKTPKKYEGNADAIISALFGLLGELLPVQERAVLRLQRLEQKQLTLAQKSVGLSEILEKCSREYAEAIAGNCTEKELALKHPGSIGQTAEYAYIKGEYTVDLTMKKADTAEVVTHYREGSQEKKHRFVMKFVGGKWLVDAVYNGNENERKWYYTEL